MLVSWRSTGPSTQDQSLAPESRDFTQGPEEISWISKILLYTAQKEVTSVCLVCHWRELNVEWFSRRIKVEGVGWEVVAEGRYNSSDPVECQRQRSTKVWAKDLFKAFCQAVCCHSWHLAGTCFSVTLKTALRRHLIFLQKQPLWILPLIWIPSCAHPYLVLKTPFFWAFSRTNNTWLWERERTELRGVDKKRKKVYFIFLIPKTGRGSFSSPIPTHPPSPHRILYWVPT